MIVIVMGVSGAGKSTVGRLLAEQLGWAFHDGDDLHPEQNVRKMSSGQPLSDEDRWPWLRQIGSVMRECERLGQSSVVACSALRADYRTYLQKQSRNTEIVFLKGSRKTILARMKARSDHFMPTKLLDSQFDALEEPSDAFVVDIRAEPSVIADAVIDQLGLSRSP